MTAGLREDARAWTNQLPSTMLGMRGLSADNLLAFLALLGLMRALEAARPEWRSRTSWSGPPWSAHLLIAAPVDQDEVAGAADAGVLMLGQAHAFNRRKNIDFTDEQFREFAKRAAHGASTHARAEADLAAALASEVNLRRDGNRVERNALCAIYGQGHQNFLERLEKLGRTARAARTPRSADPPGPARRRDGGRALRARHAHRQSHACARRRHH
jgi:hypothetical protein